MDSSAVSSQLVKLAFEVATPVVAGLVVMVLGKVFQYLKLQVSAETQAKIQTIVQNAILQAEEYVERKVQDTHIADTAGAKLTQAVTIITDKIPGITTAEATDLVHQELPKLGLGASGFIQAVRQAASTPTPPAGV